MQTSFHHQPEAQHPKSPAIETPAGRLPHLWVTADIDEPLFTNCDLLGHSLKSKI
jgi:hypothetical protein